jgi:hypothetical protein
MKNKQKAWRLGAVVMGRRARANKEAATVLGSIFLEFPQRLPAVHRKREALKGKNEGRQFCRYTGALLAPWTGYTAQEADRCRWLRGNPQAHRGRSEAWTALSRVWEII